MERLEFRDKINKIFNLELDQMIRKMEREVQGEVFAQKRLYAGTEDYVEFFKTVISTLGLDIKYEVEEVDGELEIVIGGK